MNKWVFKIIARPSSMAKYLNEEMHSPAIWNS